MAKNTRFKPEQIDDLLYKIGLCHTKLNPDTKRSWLHNQTIIIIVLLAIFIQRTLSILYRNKTKLMILVLADIGHYFHMGFIWDALIWIFAFIPVVSKGIFYYNFKRGNEPSILKVFNTISEFYMSQGPKETKKFVGYCAWFKRLNKLNQCTFWFAFIINGSPFVFFEDLQTMLLYGLPNSLVFAFWGYYLYMNIDIQFLYFYIVCKYLQLKLKKLNDKLADIQKENRMTRMMQILIVLDAIYREIKEYNSTYWSKFLFTIWFICGMGDVFLTYIAFFEPIRIEMRLIIIYGMISLGIIYLFIIFTASSVTYQSKMSYKIINSLYVKLTRSNKLPRRQKLKMMLKLNNYIECLGRKKIGFSCWVLFVINYMRCCQVIALMACIFLNVIEFTRY